ncbi:MAG: type II/IV secretion system protein [Bacteroidia bacterium]|nr:type II/IV secretion system protein [Bacteroidia bacterium]
MQDNEHIQISTDLQQLITTEQAWHYHIVPKLFKDSTIEFFIDQEYFSEKAVDTLELLLDKKVVLEPVSSGLLSKTLGRYYRKTNKQEKRTGRSQLNTFSEDFLLELIAEAYSLDSSDIHIETYEERCRIRMRIDGKLIEKYLLNKNDYPSIINKLKIKANLDIAEKRLPQDGRIFFNNGKDKFDIRVSVLPALYGEKAVLRLLSKDSATIDINELGFEIKQLNDYLEVIKKPHGIILISGPTGSGKTTTLYATLKILNKEDTNIVTIEDPVEYTLEGINQVQLKENIGLTFASALRTFLRQDPDIIMLGEIRDGETAQMAIRAALTGHLVLSTIHTNSAWSTVSRLIDMGVQPFLIADTLNATLAQRLVRLLCPSCKKEAKFDASLLHHTLCLPEHIQTHFTAAGCEQCFFTGYRGRKAVYEVIPVDFDLAENIKKSNMNVTEILKSKNIKRLQDSAFNLFKHGLTTIEEIYPILMNQL